MTITSYITEEEFLNLYSKTRPEITPEEFYRDVMKISNRLDKERFDAFKRGVEGGKNIIKKIQSL